MASIGTVLTEVVLQAQAAISTWKQFGDAAVTQFKRIGIEAARAQREAAASFGQLSRSIRNVGLESLALGKRIRSMGTAISVGIGAPLLLLGRHAVQAFRQADEGLGSSQRLIRENEEAFKELDAALVQLGKALIPIQTAIVEFITGILEAFNKLDPETKELIINIGLVAVAIGPVLFAVGGLVSAFGVLTTLFSFVVPLFSVLGPIFFGIGTAIGFVVSAVGTLVSGFAALGPIVVAAVSAAGAAIAAVGIWPILLAAALGAAIVVVVTYWDDIVNVIKQGVQAVGAILKSAWAPFPAALRLAIAAGRALWNGFISFLRGATNSFVQFFNSAVSSLFGPIQRLIDLAKSAWNWITKAKKAESSGGGGGGFAGGGQVHGRSGVDRIAAWLTNKEFVHRVAAVRKYGVGFMHAVNQGRFPVSLARGYAGGGLVGAPRYAFANGGQVRGGPMGSERGFTLVIDGQTFEGLRAPADTADEMIRYSKERQMRSTGKAQDWYR